MRLSFEGENFHRIVKLTGGGATAADLYVAFAKFTFKVLHIPGLGNDSAQPRLSNSPFPKNQCDLSRDQATMKCIYDG